MKRIDNGLDWCDLERLADDIDGALVYRRARCQHGYIHRREYCRYCDSGSMTDMHTFAAGIGPVAMWNGVECIAVSDDGEDVAYLPAKFEPRIKRQEPIEQLKRVAAGRIVLGGLDRVIQRLVARTYHYRLIEMQSNCLHIGVPDGSVDSAAWQDIAGKSPAEARPSVRYLRDGSAATCHYTPEGLPEYHIFRRV